MGFSSAATLILRKYYSILIGHVTIYLNKKKNNLMPNSQTPPPPECPKHGIRAYMISQSHSQCKLGACNLVYLYKVSYLIPYDVE